ncbi:MAG: tRNA pseudouridine(13) synthase TruD [Planctomycetia bacterium]|nr:tRNA pseudouridine(13) synthase TruD [Planctomycetia bacterium]
MKIKCKPDDFRVEELTTCEAGSVGEFTYYQLEKRSIGTPEALKQLCTAWRVDQKRVRYGGLKDRHAHTMQYLTIEHGPQRDYQDQLISVRCLGKLQEPFGPQSFHGNHFTIVMRDVSKEEYPLIMHELEAINQTLIGNYFDDQRFGSVSSDQQYVVRALIDGNEELALRLALTTYYEHDKSKEKRAKQLLTQEWGNWKSLSNKLPPGYLQGIARHLAQQPDDYRRAFTLIPYFLRNMYLSAYQSHLWNRMLHAWIMTHFPQEHSGFIQQKHHQLAMPGLLDEETRIQLKELTIPLPSSRCEPLAGHPAEEAIQSVLAQEGLSMKAIQLKQYREPFFSKGNRNAFYQPAEFAFETGWDKLHKGHRKITMKFSLPRGSYATLLVKRVTTWKRISES